MCRVHKSAHIVDGILCYTYNAGVAYGATVVKNSSEMSMKSKPIVANGRRYMGKFVATDSFNDSRVIASGDSAAAARAKAVKKGHKAPVVVYVPDTKTIHLY
jgi:hypothetical protein